MSGGAVSWLLLCSVIVVAICFRDYLSSEKERHGTCRISRFAILGGKEIFYVQYVHVGMSIIIFEFSSATLALACGATTNPMAR
eukprot:scaffold306_cov142-Skeletonema_menzelii.AAC.5